MIVREILKEPFKIIANFDWFNDYKDTRQFLLRVCRIPKDIEQYKLAIHILWFFDQGYSLHEIQRELK